MNLPEFVKNHVFVAFHRDDTHRQLERAYSAQTPEEQELQERLQAPEANAKGDSAYVQVRMVDGGHVNTYGPASLTRLAVVDAPPEPEPTTTTYVVTIIQPAHYSQLVPPQSIVDGILRQVAGDIDVSARFSLPRDGVGL